MDIVLATGGPAEMNSLVRPVAYRAALAYSAADIWVFASPASPAYRALHREVRMASGYSGVRRAFTPGEAWRLAYFAVRPRGFTVSGRGVVVNLGGGPGFAAALARRLRYPLIHYVAREYPVTPKGAALYLAEDERVQAALIADGAAPSSVRVAGNLCLDAAAPASAAQDQRRGSGRVVGLFPGEGLREAGQMIPFMLKSAELLARVERGASFMLRVSPFIGAASLDSIVKTASKPGRSEGASASMDRSSVPYVLVTEGGARVPIDTGPDHSALYGCDAVLTVPGPICHELAYSSTPYIVVAPRGLAPTRARRWSRHGRRERQQHGGRQAGAPEQRPQPSAGQAPVSGPNMRAGRAIAYEAVGAVRPEDVVIPVVEIIGDRAAADRVARGLKEAVGLPGAVEAVIQGIRSSMPR